MIRRIAGRPILTAAQMRETERRAFAAGRTTPDALMEQAGLAVTHAVHRLDPERAVLVLAGPGNNGGDAYAAACHLREWGHEVHVQALGEPKEGAAARMAARWGGPVSTFGELRPKEGVGDQRPSTSEMIVVDGLFGTGPVRAEAPSGWDRSPLGQGGAHRMVAIDLPSWLDPDSGARRLPIGRGFVDVTVALGTTKPAHLLASQQCGHLLFADLGPAILGHRERVEWIHREEDFSWRVIDRPRIEVPRADEHKYRARVSIVGGAMPGAARLAARAAAGSGAGYVTLLGATGVGPLDAVVQRSDDALEEVLAQERGVVLLGPGLGRDERARRLLDRALASSALLVLDGDALTLLGDAARERLRARTDRIDGHTVLTPHEGEFTRMFGSDGGSKFARTQAACQATGAHTIHKGACTVVALSHGELVASIDGPGWLATAGSGDVLAGIVAARWACEDGGHGRPLEQAVWLHARAAQLAGAAFSADRLADTLPAAVEEVQWRGR